MHSLQTGLKRSFRGLMGSARSACRSERGVGLIEVLVVLVIIGILAAIAIPTFLGQSDDAKETALRSYCRYLKDELDTLRVDGHDTEYRRNVSDGVYAEGYLSGELERALEVIQDGKFTNSLPYVNPYSGKTTIVNWNAVFKDKTYVPPAVFITDLSTETLTAPANTQYLRGTCVVQWVEDEDRIDIFYIRYDGTQSCLLISTVLE